jgi:hypothetical protein
MIIVKRIYQISIIEIFNKASYTIWIRATVFKPVTVDKIKKAPLIKINEAFYVVRRFYFFAALRSLVSEITFSDTFCGQGL